MFSAIVCYNWLSDLNVFTYPYNISDFKLPKKDTIMTLYELLPLCDMEA